MRQEQSWLQGLELFHGIPIETLLSKDHRHFLEERRLVPSIEDELVVGAAREQHAPLHVFARWWHGKGQIDAIALVGRPTL